MSRNKHAIAMAKPPTLPTPTSGLNAMSPAMPPSILKPPAAGISAPPSPLKPPAFKPVTPPRTPPEVIAQQNRYLDQQHARRRMTSMHGPRPGVAPIPGTQEAVEHAEFSKALQQPGMSVMGAHGAAVDPNGPDALKYWTNAHDARRMAIQRDGHQSPASQFNPTDAAKNYILARASRQRDETEADAAGTGLLGAYQRLRGFKRPNALGKYQTTTDDKIGIDPNGRSSAWATSLASAPALVGAAITGAPQVLAGDLSPLAGAARGLMAGPNHETNSDIGWNWKPDAAVHTPFDASPELQKAFTQSDLNTTPNLFGSPVWDPISKAYKPSQFDAAANQARMFANDASNPAGQVEKGIAGTLASTMHNTRDAYGAAIGGRLLGIHGAPRVLANPVAGGAALGALTATDQNAGATLKDRALPTAKDMFNKSMSQFAVNPAINATSEVMNRSGVQDVANTAGQYIRDSYGGPADGKLQQSLSSAAAGTIESAPKLLTYLLRKDPQGLAGGLNGIKQMLAGGAKNVGAYAGLGGAAAGLQTALSKTPTTPEELAQASAASNYIKNTSLMQQKDDSVTQDLSDMQRLQQDSGRPSNAALDNIVAQRTSGPQQSAQQPAATFNLLDVLPTAIGAAVKKFVATNTEMAAKMQESAQKTLTAAATTGEGKKELANIQQTGDLSPAANATVKYNLLSDGFDSAEIGKWYNKLEGPEKFALWGGVSMTMLGLMHAMNGGGIGGVLAALLGLGTAGLTAGQSGLFGGTAQQASQKVTQPVGNAVKSIGDMANNAMQNPAVIKALAPMLDRMPDASISLLQRKLRQYKPEEAAKLDAATNTSGLVGFANSVSGYGNSEATKKLIGEYGFSPAAAAKWLELWPQSR